MKKIVTLLLVLLIAFVAYTLVSTGFFRNIETPSTHPILARIALKGAEDLVIDSKETFAIISATDRSSYPPQKKETGGLYFLDLKDPTFTPHLLTQNINFDFAPHGIDLIQLTDSSYQILAINHINKQHSIEKFVLKNKALEHIETLRHPSMIQPNDLVQTEKDAFYFTNDHGYTKGIGKLIEEYGGLAVSNVVYAKGTDYREVASGIAYANGIAYDPQRMLVFVASPRHFSVKVYQRQIEGSLTHIEDIDCHTGVDNLTLDNTGKIWIGAHPNLLRFASYSQGKHKLAPSEIITITYSKKGQYTVESVWVDNGENMSGATVAVPYKDGILTGNVMDNHFLILERKK